MIVALLAAVAAAAASAPVRVVDVGWSFVSVFALDGEDGVVLVDARYRGNEDRVLRRLAREGVDPERARLLVVTHAHADHAGAAAAIRERLGVPIAAGSGDVPALATGEMTDLHFTGWKGRALSALIVRSYPPFAPDVVIGDRLDLEPYGVPGAEVRQVGGHTPGELVVTVPGGIALVGDLVRSRILRRHRPQIHFVQDDVFAAHRALDELLEEGYTTFLPSHGGAIDGEVLADWLAGPRVRKEARIERRLERQSRKASR